MSIPAKMMLIRTSISKTKKFFKSKLDSFKIFITGGYQRLPSRSKTDNDKDCALENLIEFKTEREDQRKEIMRSCPDINNQQKKGLSFSRSARERRACLVGEKLIRELEVVDTRSSVEHRLDVEEVLHYYTRLTCPAYRDIVDQFLVNLYDDIFDQQNPSFG